MHFAVRNKRAVGFGLALLLVLAPVGAASGSPRESTTLSVASARAEVARAEQQLVAATTARATAGEELDDLTATSAALVAQISAARTNLRRQAVGAYIDAEPGATALAIINGEDVFDASARVNLRTHSAERSSDALARYRRIKSDVDPRLAALADRIDRLDREVADANDAVLAARANEAEAERQEAIMIAEQQAAREAARAAAAAAATTTTTTIAVTTAPPTVAADSVPADAPAPTPTSAAPPTTAAPVNAAPSAPLPAAPSGGPSESKWAALRACESGGNYRAVSKSGKYRGAYQFDARTWAGLGGAGDPAAAPPAEQDARAKLLYSQRGWRPWPVCGRHLI